MPKVHVRDYTPNDREACLAVFDSNVPTFFVPAEREQFAAFLSDLPGPYIVLEDESGTVLGCGGFAVEAANATADLCWGMVSRTHHGTGLGRLLTRIRLERARADDSVQVVALKTSQHTRGFYERLGFVTERILPDGYAPGLDRCEMRLHLSS